MFRTGSGMELVLSMLADLVAVVVAVVVSTHGTGP